MTERSIVEYFSGHEGYRCGYCKSDNSCYSHGMWAHNLNALDYQNLMDRGWRRSGRYCYKPTMHMTCCPQYTIRCEAKKFHLSKSQKKILKKVHKFLAHGDQEQCLNEQSLEESDQKMEVCELPQAVDIQSLQNVKKTKDIKQTDVENLCFEMPSSKDLESSLTSVHSNTESSQVTNVPEKMSSLKSSNMDPNKPMCRKAKLIRREKRLQKLLNKGLSAEEAESSVEKKASQPKSLEDFILEPFASDPVYKLELRLVPSSLENPLFIQTFEETYSVYKKYQMTIHKDPAEKCTKKQFIRFLVKSPFQVAVSSTIPGYGSFHQQYWLNDRLIAVGVIDILPYCLSSVYFYYDPDFGHLSLGTYAALREIAFTRELNTRYPDLQYYYMGFYIHSCIKMRYKGQYVPSFLLCPETYIFKPIELCRPKLDISKYQRLEEDPTKDDKDGVVNLKEVLILYDKTLMTYPMYATVNKRAGDEAVIKEYAGFVGRKCYRRMLLFRS